MGPCSLGVKVRAKFEDFRTSVFVERNSFAKPSKNSWRYRNLLTIWPAALVQGSRTSTTTRYALAVAGTAN
jgi:hypothetical protein